MISKRGFDPADDETPEPESQSQTPRRLASSAETDPSPVPDPIWYGDTPLTFAPAAATADTDAVTEVDTDATPDADTEPDADLEPDTDTTPDIDVTPDTDTDTETEPETDTPAPEADTPTPETTPRKPTISKGSIAAKVAGLLLAIAASASVVWLALAAHRSDMLPERYFWFAVGGSVAVVLALGVGLVMVRPHRRRVGYALLMCAAALVTAGSLFLANVFANVKHFTDGISGGIQSVTLTYVIIAPLPAGLTNPDATDLPPATGTSPSPGASPATPSATPTKPTATTTPPSATSTTTAATPSKPQSPKPHTALSDLAGRNIGIIVNDPNRAKATDILNNLISANQIELNSASDVVSAMGEGSIQAACVDRSIYRLWAEHEPEFFTGIEVVKTFRMKITPDPPQPISDDPATPFIVYISGIDTSEGLDEVGRSDSNMLFAVNPATGRIALINTPRDYYVQLHNTSWYPDKLTHAGTYGIDMSVGTMEDLYDIHIDYWVRINFSSVVDIVNAVGGIDVDVPLAFRCYAGAYTWDGYQFDVGLTHMDGSQALCFSRERKAFEDGDRQRGKNQQAVIEALIEKLSRPSILLNYNAVLNALAPNMETSMPSERIASLAKRQLDLGTDWQVTEYSVSGYDDWKPTYSMGSDKMLYVMTPDQATVDEAKALIDDVMSGR